MTPADFYKAMALPDECLLGKRVFKKLLHENANLTAADKRALSKDVDTIFWQYTLKPSTVPVSTYVDDEHEYLEIALIEAALTERRNAPRIAEVIHRALRSARENLRGRSAGSPGAMPPAPARDRRGSGGHPRRDQLRSPARAVSRDFRRGQGRLRRAARNAWRLRR